MTVADDLTKWRGWIEGPIRNDVVGMHFRRMVWREVQSMLEGNATVGQIPSAFWDFYEENYAAGQAIAIRRQADRDERTCSLALLIVELRDHPELLTRDAYVALLGDRQGDDLMVQRAHRDFDQISGGDHFDRDIADRDFAALRSDAKRVSVYVNEHLAHDMASPTVAELPTFADLHAAIDSVGDLFRKYALMLTGGWWATLEPVIQDDWKAIFRVPWMT